MTMDAQDCPAADGIRHLLERTPADPDVLHDLIERDPAFAQQCREYRDVAVSIHRLRERHARIEQELLARIEAVSEPVGGERVTKADLHAVQADLRCFLADLIKAGLVSTNEEAVHRWHAQAMNLHEDLRLRLAAFTDEEVRLDALWNRAHQEAQSDPLVQAEENMKPILSAKCLFALQELAAPDFSFVAAAARVRTSTPTG
jgi:hypothetical protein